MLIIALISFFLSTSSCTEIEISYDDLVGEYKAYKEQDVQDLGNGWIVKKRYERVLILLSDSTYKEINTTFEEFDMVDFYGTWKVSGNTIKLIPEGFLEYNNGKWTPKRVSGQEIPQSKYLYLESNKELKIIEEGFLRNEILKNTAYNKE